MPLNPNVDPNNDTYSGIRSAYKNYLGRDASDDEVDFHYNTSPDNYNDVIKGSSEAQTWAKSQQPTSSSGPAGAQPWDAPSGGTQGGIDAFWNEVTNKKRNDFTDGELAHWGVSRISQDKYRLPNGQEVDIQGDIGGANIMGQWTISGGKPGENGQGVNWGADPSGKTMWGSGGGGSASSSSSSSGPANSNPGAYNDLLGILMGRAKQSLSIDPTTDPIIRPQVDNAAAMNERSRRGYLNDLAESSNPYATGSLNTAATQTAEKAGQANANLQSELVSKELTSRRDEIQNALSELGNLLSGDQQRSLSMELAQIDRALRQQQLNSGNDQFLASLGLQAENQNNYWDWMRSGGGR